MTNTFEAVVTLQKEICGSCSGVFALSVEFIDHARKHARGFHCPYCQTAWSWTESEAAKLRKELELKERELRESKCEVLRQKQLLDEEVAKASKLARRTRNGVSRAATGLFKT